MSSLSLQNKVHARPRVMWAVNSPSTAPEIHVMPEIGQERRNLAEIFFGCQDIEQRRSTFVSTIPETYVQGDIDILVYIDLMNVATSMESLGYVLPLFGGFEAPVTETESLTTTSLRETQYHEDIRKLVEAGRIHEARRRLALIPASFSSAEVKRWSVLLAEPKITVAEKATGSALKRNADWLRINGPQHKGMWVALKDGEFLAGNKNRAELHRTLKSSDKLRGAVFFRIA